MSDLEAPTPSPVSSPPNASYTLSESINIATRPIHSLLNRAILARLPLALPPHSTNPSIYVSGLLHIAPIYIAFESLWQSILDAPHLPGCDDGCDPECLMNPRSTALLTNNKAPPLVHLPTKCSRTRTILSHLRLPGLLRGDRLRADIRNLTGRPEHEIEEHLKAVAQNGELAAFIAHTTHSVEASPHVLLAYSWVLYMAIFSGGRYIRAVLQSAEGPDGDFWARESSPVRTYSAAVLSDQRRSRSEFAYSEQSPLPARARSRSEDRGRRQSESAGGNAAGLQFFNFSGDEDGEDIKRDFKKRLTEAEDLLTLGEKEDIVIEAEHIFNFMLGMVDELDTVCGTSPAAIAKSASGHRPLDHSRDSVQLTRDRLAQTQTHRSRSHRAGDLQNTMNLSRSASIDGQGTETDSQQRFSQRLVHFDDLGTKSRLYTASKSFCCLIKPSSCRSSPEKCARSQPTCSPIDLSSIFISTVAFSIIIGAFAAWHYHYPLF